MASVSESRDCCSLADPGHVTLVVRDRANCGLFLPFWVIFFQFLGKNLGERNDAR